MMDFDSFKNARAPKRTREEAYETRTTHSEIVRAVKVKPIHDADWIIFDNCARVLLFAHIALFTIGVALQETLKKTERINVNTATNDQLIARLKHYDQITDATLISLFCDRTNWIPFTYNNVDVYCIKELGEIVDARGFLVGGFHQSKIKSRINNKNVQRAHLVLFACGYKRPSDKHTADHVDPMKPSCDAISNLRWANKTEQVNNRIFSNRTRVCAIGTKATNTKTGAIHHFPSKAEMLSFFGVTGIPCISVENPSRTYKEVWQLEIIMPNSTTVGRALPEHPIHKDLHLSEFGYYKFTNGAWRQQHISRPTITNYGIHHRIVTECILGRTALVGEEGDHIDGDSTNNMLRNLWPVTRRINNIKKYQSFIIGTDNAGNNHLYLSPTDAENVTHINGSHISEVANGKLKTAGGCHWRIASTTELHRIFDLINLHIAQLSWTEKLKMLDKYKDDKLYDTMHAQALLSQEYATKLAEFYGGFGCSGGG